MWILECDGDVFAHKRIWLRPGKQYLFGRTHSEGGKYAEFTIDNKSVSRKHLTLTVSAVKSGDGSLVHARSELCLEDERTKIGTEIDGERIKGEKKILRNDEHVFRLGNYEHLFRIKWHSVVLSFMFPSKESKGGKDPLIPVRSQLEDLDVKTIIPYLRDKTTHVVANKRNTPKGLQALINGKFIVDNSFMDALVYAATPSNLDEPESLSSLERDFDGNWPNAMNHLPPRSKEPGQRPDKFFAPDPARQDIFEGYTFVFCNSRQFDNLQAPINNSGGKALQFPITMGETSVEQVVRYMKGVAGEKGVGEFEDGSEGRGAVLVRFQGDKGFEDWAIQLQHDVAQTLDLRLIEQNEFLDAILINDASKLRRALPEARPEETRVDPRVATSESSSVHATQNVPSDDIRQSAQPEPSQTRRVRPRGNIVRAFKGFDDGFDQSQILTERRSVTASSQAETGANGNLQRGVSFANSAMEMDSDNSNADRISTKAILSKKRPPPSESEDEDILNDNLLPAAAAMKRRKLEEEADARRNGTSVAPANAVSKTKLAMLKTPKARKEINIQEVVREHREAKDKAARLDEESLRQTLDELTVEQMKSLAVVEMMEIAPRVRPRVRPDGNAENERWDDSWNGRKNFKKFRRRGLGIVPRRVIVPLEEIKKKDYGIGQEYWQETSKTTKIRKEKELVSQSQSQPISTSTTHHEEEVPAELAIEDGPDIIDVDAPRATWLSDKTTQSQTQSNRPQKPKRAATTGGGRAVAAKKQKTRAAVSDSESEDELKFRFRKRA